MTGDDAPTPPARRVEEILVDMKDNSELMVDLAYSALLYDSQSIAAEVVSLEEEMSTHFDLVQRLSLEAVKDGSLSIDHAIVLLHVAQAAEVIANSALEIADVVLRDMELHPVIKESIRESDSTITKVSLHPESAFSGKKLGDIELETEWGMRILAAKRAGRWHSGIDGEFVVEPGDILVAMGPLEAEEDFLVAADPEIDLEE